MKIRELLEGQPGFNYASEYDKENYMALKGLVKHNNGYFKWPSQAKKFQQNYKNPAQAKQYLGIDVPPGQRSFEVSASMSFGSGRGKGFRPLLYVFLLDDFGVTALYKVPHTYDETRGSHTPNPARTELVWQRTTDQSKEDALKKDADDRANALQAKISKAKHMGHVGETIQVNGKIVFANDYDGNFGPYRITIIETDDGNSVVYMGSKNLGDKGAHITLSAKVKAHTNNKKTNGPETVIRNPKLIT